MNASSEQHLQFVLKLAHSPLHNYVIPGLTSYLIGEQANQTHKRGRVRLFVSEREHFEPITPHSHRFDFTCHVLKGCVSNTIWTPADSPLDGDIYMRSRLMYEGSPGEYTALPISEERWVKETTQYNEGDTYQMTADQVHSIHFSRGAHVLFFEGPNVSDTNIILEPVANGEHIKTFKTEPWMFKRGQEIMNIPTGSVERTAT